MDTPATKEIPAFDDANLVTAPTVERSPEVSALVGNLQIKMVRNKGADSMLVIGSLAYPLGSTVDPTHGLRFVGFSNNGKTIVFSDNSGAHYEREF